MAEIIAELGINHNGVFERAVQMVNDAFQAGCKIVKFQTHVVEDEYVPSAKDIVPANASENIYDMMQRCSFSEAQERELKAMVEGLGMTYLSTPFSRAAADRLERMGVSMYKIGSGECNNYPLIKHIAAFGKPVILSTGMNTLESIDRAVDILGDNLYVIMHCVSMYPTPYEKVNLRAMYELRERYGKPVGLSDHSIGIWTSLAAVAMGAQMVEKHFTSFKGWPGADVPISINPRELSDLVRGVRAIEQAMGEGEKRPQTEEQLTANFAYACVVTTQPVYRGETFTDLNIWVKRPGTGEILAGQYETIIGKRSKSNIPPDTQVKWSDID